MCNKEREVCRMNIPVLTEKLVCSQCGTKTVGSEWDIRDEWATCPKCQEQLHIVGVFHATIKKLLSVISYLKYKDIHAINRELKKDVKRYQCEAELWKQSYNKVEEQNKSYMDIIKQLMKEKQDNV